MPCFSYIHMVDELFSLVAMEKFHRLQATCSPLSFWNILRPVLWDHITLLILPLSDISLVWWYFHTVPWDIPSFFGPKRPQILSSSFFLSSNLGETAVMILLLIACWRFLRLMESDRSHSQLSLIILRSVCLSPFGLAGLSPGSVGFW